MELRIVWILNVVRILEFELVSEMVQTHEEGHGGVLGLVWQGVATSAREHFGDVCAKGLFADHYTVFVLLEI